jgi:hypothetical protein
MPRERKRKRERERKSGRRDIDKGGMRERTDRIEKMK